MISLSNPASGYVSSFSPYCRAEKISLVDDNPIAHAGNLYYEVLGTSFWLVQSLVGSNPFFVSDSDGVVMSGRFWNPCQAVLRLKELMELEEGVV